jgi:hypothetical protein
MLTHMRTSVEICDSLLARARQVMERRRVTLRSLVEEGLRRVLHDEREMADFRLRDARFDGETGFAHGRSEADVAEAIRVVNEGRAFE